VNLCAIIADLKSDRSTQRLSTGRIHAIDPPQSAAGGLNIQYSIENIQSFEDGVT